MAISTDPSVYVAGITTYTIVETSDNKFEVSYQVGVGVTHIRTINRSGDPIEDEARLDAHLLGVNNKVFVGAISTTPPTVSPEEE
jgi:hypothetical protein